MLALKPSRAAAKFVSGLPAKQFRQVLLKILSLLNDPYPTVQHLKIVSAVMRELGIGRIVATIELPEIVMQSLARQGRKIEPMVLRNVAGASVEAPEQ